jgi:hypothetical protein
MLTSEPFYNEKVVFIRGLASLEGGVHYKRTTPPSREVSPLVKTTFLL